jgi:hypothetical protein
MPYVPPHLRNKNPVTEDVPVPVSSGESKPPRVVGGGEGYMPPHLRNNKSMPFGEDGPKFEVYTSDIIEAVETQKKVGYVPPSMRKNESLVVKKKAEELTEDDFPDLGAVKPVTVTGKSVAWGKKPVIVEAPVVLDASQNQFAILGNMGEEEKPVPVKTNTANKWSKKLDVTIINEEVIPENDDDGKNINLTFEGTVRWWSRFASLPVYIPLEARNYYDDYSNCTHIPHSGLRDENSANGYDDYYTYTNSGNYIYDKDDTTARIY